MDGLIQGLMWNVGVAGLLAVGVWCVARLPGVARRPGVVYGLWLLVLAKLGCPPLVGVPVFKGLPVVVEEVAPVSSDLVPWEEVPLEREGLAVVHDERELQGERVEVVHDWEVRKEWDPRMGWWVALGVSLLGTVMLWGMTWRQTARWGRLLRECGGGDERLQRLIQQAAGQMGVSREVRVRVVPAVLTPFLWVKRGGVEVVLSAEVVSKLTEEELLCVLCHELAHYRRRDHWGHLFAGWVVSVFWWNPIGWWGWRELRAAQEVCCDALVLARNGEGRRLYAETLFKVLELVQTGKRLQPSLACGFGDGAHLRRRFEMLADLKLQSGISWWMKLCVVPCVGLLFCLPIRGEGEKQKEEAAVQKAVGISEERVNLPPVSLVDEHSGEGRVARQQAGQAMQEFVMSMTFWSQEKGSEAVRQVAPAVTMFEGTEGMFAFNRHLREGTDGKLIEPNVWLRVIPRLNDEGKVECRIQWTVGYQAPLNERHVIQEWKQTVELGKTARVEMVQSVEHSQWLELTCDSFKSVPVKVVSEAVTAEMKVTPAQEHYFRVSTHPGGWGTFSTVARFKMTLHDRQWGAAVIPLDQERELVVHFIPKTSAKKRGEGGYWFGTEYRQGEERKQPVDREGLELPFVMSGGPHVYTDRLKGDEREVKVQIGGLWWMAEQKPKDVVKVYGVSDLIVNPGGDWEKNAKELAALLKMDDPAAWVENGGIGTIETNRTTRSLVVRQTEGGHRRIESRLEELKQREAKSAGKGRERASAEGTPRSNVVISSSDKWEKGAVQNKELGRLISEWESSGDGLVVVPKETLSRLTKGKTAAEREIAEWAKGEMKERSLDSPVVWRSTESAKQIVSERLQGFRVEIEPLKKGEESKPLQGVLVKVENRERLKDFSEGARGMKVQLFEGQTMVLSKGAGEKEVSLRFTPKSVNAEGDQVFLVKSREITAQGVEEMERTDVWPRTTVAQFVKSLQVGGEAAQYVVSVRFQGVVDGKEAHKKSAQEPFVSRRFVVKDLLPTPEKGLKGEKFTEEDGVRLMQQLKKLLPAESWEEGGGEGGMWFNVEQGSVVVQQTEKGQLKIALRLAEMLDTAGISEGFACRREPPLKEPKKEELRVRAKFQSGKEGVARPNDWHSVVALSAFDGQVLVFENLIKNRGSGVRVRVKRIREEEKGVRVRIDVDPCVAWREGAAHKDWEVVLQYRKGEEFVIVDEGKSAERCVMVLEAFPITEERLEVEPKKGAEVSEKKRGAGTMRAGLQPTVTNVLWGVAGTALLASGLADVGEGVVEAGLEAAEMETMATGKGSVRMLQIQVPRGPEVRERVEGRK